MKKSFGARRIPRKVGGDEDEDVSLAAETPSAGNSSLSENASLAVKRPTNKHRKSSALRTSFASSSLEDDDTDESSVVAPKRSTLSRIAIQRNAEKRPAPDVTFRSSTQFAEERPSYSKEHLDELKQSTPTTPRDLSSRDPSEPIPDDSRALDITSKFGSDLSRYKPPTIIPTDAEIQEKKERRARLAKEDGFISLDQDMDEDEDDEDDENVMRDDQGRLILKPKEKYPETRLVQDDEDMLEGFDDFTSDRRTGFGPSAEKEAAKRRKAEMAALIADAERASGDEDDEDDSEAERNAAFEVAQTRHGTYAQHGDEDKDIDRPQTPPRILPIPTLDSVVERLRMKLQEVELLRMAKTKEMQGLVDEKARIGEEEVRVQAALKETGEKFAQLRAERTSQDEVPNGHGSPENAGGLSVVGGEANQNGSEDRGEMII